MATSQARLCDLVRTPGAHSLTTFREATASQIETYQTSATRASLELGVSQPFSLGLSDLDAATIREAEQKARAEWQKGVEEAERREEEARQRRRAAYLSAVTALQTRYEVTSRTMGQVLVKVTTATNASGIRLTLRLEFSVGASTYTGRAEVAPGERLVELYSITVRGSQQEEVSLKVGADEAALASFVATG